MTSSTPRSVVVLAGGISHERDVSLRSGRRVADSLTARGHTVILRDPDSTLLDFLDETTPDIVWPALHGASGEEGALGDLLDTQGVPYVSSGPDASRLAWHKPTAKVLARRAGHATPASITLSRDTVRELGATQTLQRVIARYGTELAVKPAKGGSAQGVTLVETAADLPRAVMDAFTYGDEALIEQRVHGTEISIGIIDLGEGPIALPSIEIVPRSGTYSFEARYNAGETRFFTPARMPEYTALAAQDAAVGIFKALGMRHISRIDFIVDPAGTPWFLEANVLPGLTETSIIPLELAAAGLDAGAVYETLAELAIADANLGHGTPNP